jgi:hypothetical protein
MLIICGAEPSVFGVSNTFGGNVVPMLEPQMHMCSSLLLSAAQIDDSQAGTAWMNP